MTEGQKKHCAEILEKLEALSQAIEESLSCIKEALHDRET